MICILHGYLLEGSGSNLWTRSIIQSLCRDGETIHLLCQENHPELYDFISAAHYYHPDGRDEIQLERDVPYSGRCIMHKPYIGNTLPVYVWDQYEEFSDVQPMIYMVCVYNSRFSALCPSNYIYAAENLFKGERMIAVH